MEHRTTVVEVCPGCASLDVRAAEPAWFMVEIERRDEIGRRERGPHADEIEWVERLELTCRDCGMRWG